MPEGGTTVLPIREKKDEWREFCAGRTANEHVAYGYWCDIWKHTPELAHICHARKTLNFQHCTLCVEGEATQMLLLHSSLEMRRELLHPSASVPATTARREATSDPSCIL